MRHFSLMDLAFALMLLAFLALACENPQPDVVHAPESRSVRWEHHNQHSGAEPICHDATVTRDDAEHIRCRWDCLWFWTNTHGVHRYTVSREWILTEGQWVSGAFFPYPENQDEWSGLDACEAGGLPPE